MPAEPIAEQVAGDDPAIAANRAQANTLATPEPAGHAVQPGMQRRIEVLAGAGLADRRALQDEKRDRQQRDRGHFLVDVLGHGIERCRGHVDAHEHHRDGTERERDRHARKHRKQGRDTVADANSKYGHRRAAPADRNDDLQQDLQRTDRVMPDRHQDRRESRAAATTSSSRPDRPPRPHAPASRTSRRRTHRTGSSRHRRATA